MRPRLDSSWLRSWPLLIAATIAVVAGAKTLASTSARDVVGFCLIVIGAVCLGAWIAMLSSHGHTGTSDNRVDPTGAPPDGPAESSAPKARATERGVDQD